MPSFIIKRYESPDDYEYYVDTRSGVRHRIEQIFADYNLDAMTMLRKIEDRYPWVQITEEAKQ